MSVFAGRMQEIKDISVDNFQNENLFSTAYFLSHAHKDHMKGLWDEDFRRRLYDSHKYGSGVYLYCSEITRLYLINMNLNKIEKFIRVLQLGSSIVEYPSATEPHRIKSLNVTCFPAGHCPGSLMFLFETDECRVFYTGDFRIYPKDIIKFSSLMDRKIDTLYLDATFFDRSYSYFPSRAESASIVCNTIREWLDLSKRHMVFLDLPAHCGTENIFAEINRTLGIKVHVQPPIYKRYEGIEEIRPSLTDHAHTRVHACCKRDSIRGLNLPCLGNGYHIRIIKPSAMWFKSRGKDAKPLFRISLEGYGCKVAHSSHASFTELAGIIRLLKPIKISPTALPPSKRRRDVMMLLKELTTNDVSEDYLQNDSDDNSTEADFFSEDD